MRATAISEFVEIKTKAFNLKYIIVGFKTTFNSVSEKILLQEIIDKKYCKAIPRNAGFLYSSDKPKTFLTLQRRLPWGYVLSRKKIPAYILNNDITKPYSFTEKEQLYLLLLRNLTGICYCERHISAKGVWRDYVYYYMDGYAVNQKQWYKAIEEGKCFGVRFTITQDRKCIFSKILKLVKVIDYDRKDMGMISYLPKNGPRIGYYVNKADGLEYQHESAFTCSEMFESYLAYRLLLSSDDMGFCSDLANIFLDKETDAFLTDIDMRHRFPNDAKDEFCKMPTSEIMSLMDSGIYRKPVFLDIPDIAEEQELYPKLFERVVF